MNQLAVYRWKGFITASVRSRFQWCHDRGLFINPMVWSLSYVRLFAVGWAWAQNCLFLGFYLVLALWSRDTHHWDSVCDSGITSFGCLVTCMTHGTASGGSHDLPRAWTQRFGGHQRTRDDSFFVDERWELQVAMELWGGMELCERIQHVVKISE